MHFHSTVTVLINMLGYYSYIVKCNTNLTLFMKFVQHKLLRETKANLSKCFMVAEFDYFPLPPKNLLSKKYHPAVNRCPILCRKGRTQAEKRHIQIHISLNLRGSRRKRKIYIFKSFL